MNLLVTICARGGSKGVKEKNIRDLCGKPLIVHTIEQAKKWGRTDDIVVSTDSEKIAFVAKEYGAKVPFMRPDFLAKDDSPKLPVVRHALLNCEEIYNKKYDIIVDLDASSPIRKVSDIEGCYQKFIEKMPQTLFSVVQAHRNPYFNMVEEDASGYVKVCKKLPNGVYRRQDAPAVYDMNASIYFYRRDYLLDEKNTLPYSEKSLAFVMDDLSSYDIDREVDFKFIEFLIKEGIFS